jgi:hypothetical protein
VIPTDIVADDDSVLTGAAICALPELTETEETGAVEPGVPVPALGATLGWSDALVGIPLPDSTGVVVGVDVLPGLGDRPAPDWPPLRAPCPNVVEFEWLDPMASEPWGLEGAIAMTVAAQPAATTEAATEATATRCRRGEASERRVWRRS